MFNNNAIMTTDMMESHIYNSSVSFCCAVYACLGECVFVCDQNGSIECSALAIISELCRNWEPISNFASMMWKFHCKKHWIFVSDDDDDDAKMECTVDLFPLYFPHWLAFVHLV